MAPIDVLLNLVPQHPDKVLSHLSTYPDLAAAADANGYTLMHAAASYGHVDLLRTLATQYHVSPDIADPDQETPLFAVEELRVARCLVEELGARTDWVNEEGRTARERIEEEGEFPELAVWLKSRESGASGRETRVTEAEEGVGVETLAGTEGSVLNRPPPLPEGMQVNMSMEAEQPEELSPDPEFRRRIEELAAREDFQSEEGQAELRRLVTEAVTGLGGEPEREVRRRLD
ncbi:hypothetical protein P152DRAFT_15781 [Eremomyces bilateralis CBS 781.70]|uniref:Ankyrin n=1 Tax=Eremomyces bilateralis CBS 781.70 TaxID=1392243 RepID=A0A6G1GGW4_9PEZI|nr:uncharacterized protein P152DRAFT_15781 [Eremomyces bilateralis CBS 781.70]KAF1817347.1 hypothetical protein P152DRAFT_15781 [Eremomyces bilateralis CBS 781.70]